MKGSLADDSTRLGFSVDRDSRDRYDNTRDSSMITAPFHNQIIKAQARQLALLKHRCQNLTNSTNSLKAENQRLRKEKEALLALNGQYINSLNTSYELRGQSIQKVNFPYELWQSAQLEPKLKEYLKLHIAGFKKLEVDHRNLVLHCITMQKQIKTLQADAQLCSEMRQQLLSVNHTDILALAKEIQMVSTDNRQLRSQNNKVSYDYEKAKQDLQRTRAHLKQAQTISDRTKQDLAETKASLNRILEDGKQKNNCDQKQIYALNVKCSALEEELRGLQSEAIRVDQQKHKLQVVAVQFAHRETAMKKTLSESSRRAKQSIRSNSIILNSRDAKDAVSFFYEQRRVNKRRMNRSQASVSVSD